ncbi:MAG: protein kinase, partial [bacterium]|nr:protein kinase [bacterium]
MAVCLNRKELEAFATGELPAAERKRAELHLASCATCRSSVDIRLKELSADGKPAPGSSPAVDVEATLTADLERERDATAAAVKPTPGYEILREIHRGGQGVVYEAVQLATKRVVALKVLLHGPFASARQQHRFEREIDLVASLQHPNIITVFDSGIAEGRPYFAMEYIHGHSLDEYMAQAKPSIAETLRLFRKICCAVNAAH